MRKSVTKIVKAVLGFTMAIGAFVGAAMSGSKANPVVASVPNNQTITFNTNGDSDNNTAYTTSSTIAKVANGAAAFSSVSEVSKVYSGKDGTGLKFGTSSAVGYIGFNLASGYQNNLKSIEVTVMKYGSDTGNVILKTGSASNTWSSGSTQRKTITPPSDGTAGSGTYTFDTPATVGRIWLGTSAKRAYVTQMVLHYEENLATSVQFDSKPAYLVDGGASGTIIASIINNNNYTITWSSSDNSHVAFSPNPSNSGASVSVSFDGVTTGTSPISITATLNDAGSTSASFDVYALEHAGTSLDPFSATDAMVFSHNSYAKQSGGDWYVQGYVVGTYQTNKGYYIDEDPSATTEPYKFEVYNSSGVTNSTGKDIIVGTSYIVAHGSMTYFVSGSQCETSGSVITSVDNGAVPGVVIDGGDRTVNINDSLTLTATTENPDDAVVSWSSDAPLVATINSSTGAVTLIGVGTANITASITVATQEYTNTIVLTVERCPVEIGKTYVISAVYSETTYYLSGIENSLGTCSTNENEALVLTVEAGTQAGSYAFGNNGHYLKAKNGNNLETEDDITDDSSWLVSYNGTIYSMHNVGQNTRLLSYNDNGHAADSNKINRFAAYTSQLSSPIIITEVTAPEVDEVTVIGNASVNANGAVSVVEDFLYEVSYVDPLNPGNGSVNVTVLNSNDEADGASVTSAPNGISFSVTFTASDTYTVTVTSAEDNGKSTSVTITISNIYVPPVPVVNDYELYEEDVLVEGDYIIVYGGAAMNNTIDGDRAQYDDVTPVGDTISTDDASIVWHIAPATGDYFTIYNSEAGEYLASTGAKNKAQLLDDESDDKSLWSVEADGGKFDFTNKKNTANGVNAILRKNTTYGFACYGSGTGGKLSLYRLNDIGAYLSSATAVATLTDDILRLGSSVQESVWNSVVATGEITDYGVMIYKTDSEAKITSDTPVEDAYRAGVVQPAIARKGNGTAPSLTNGTYVFTARVRVSNPNTIFCSASFVVVGGQYYFFNEQHISASQLAS